MIIIKSTNDQQKKVLADFYSNFALVWLTLGFVTPIFTTTQRNILEFLGGLLFSIFMGGLLLRTSLKFLD